MTASLLPTLAALRATIDRIDAAMHELLMERGEIVAQLITVKGTQESGSAFRPAREAAMMRALIERHHGLLPLDTVEGIWRVIIATFTHLQAPYTVHGVGGDAMRDSARFHFGFTVPIKVHDSPSAVIAAIAGAQGDLGLLPIEIAPNEPWWTALIPPGAPKIIARLPFVERSCHPAGSPVFVVSKPLEDAAVRETALYAATSHQPITPAPALDALNAHVIMSHGLHSLIEAPGEVLKEALHEALGLQSGLSEIGGHAARFRFTPA